MLACWSDDYENHPALPISECHARAPPWGHATSPPRSQPWLRVRRALRAAWRSVDAVHTRACAEPAARRLLRRVSAQARHGLLRRHRPSDHRGYDPPEGWGWCYVDRIEVDLPDQTPRDGPFPRFLSPC